MFSKTALAKMIDHSLLRADCSEEEVIRFCEHAREMRFATVIVCPYWVGTAAKHLRSSDVKVGTVIGFPFGAIPPACKVYEARQAIAMGAAELDVSLNIGAVRSACFEVVRREIEDIVTLAKVAGLTEHGEEILVKVILETGLTNYQEQERVCRIAEEVRADFVKTCSGFGPRGVTVEDVRFLRHVVGRDVGIKASGGIRTYEQAQALINAGANRLGTSSGQAILEGYARAEQPIAEEVLERD